MPVIKLDTLINAPIERCFLLATSVDLHMDSVSETSEQAVAGKTSGLVNLNDSITWEARHLGFKQYLTSKITAYEKPCSFTDEMTKGIFKKLHHQHLFRFENNQTIMTDIFEFEAPLGLFGRIAEKLFLTNYMLHFLTERNTFLKKVAEGTSWQKYI